MKLIRSPWTPFAVCYRLAGCLLLSMAGMGIAAPPTVETTPYPTFQTMVDWTHKRLAMAQLRADEKRMDQIGWVTSLEEARRLAKEHQRPVFFFMHQGRIDRGRC